MCKLSPVLWGRSEVALCHVWALGCIRPTDGFVQAPTRNLAHLLRADHIPPSGDHSMQVRHVGGRILHERRREWPCLPHLVSPAELGHEESVRQLLKLGEALAMLSSEQARTCLERLAQAWQPALAQRP